MFLLTSLNPKKFVKMPTTTPFYYNFRVTLNLIALKPINCSWPPKVSSFHSSRAKRRFVTWTSKVRSRAEGGKHSSEASGTPLNAPLVKKPQPK